MALLTFASLVLACIAVSTSAAPAHSENGHRQIGLDFVKEKSVCPIEVKIDVDENRIPRRIKMLKCAANPNPICKAEHIKHACCNTSHHLHFSMQCVEVMDTVWVRYTNNGNKLEQVSIPVGCSCMLRNETEARVVANEAQ